MERASDKSMFVKQIAEELSIGCDVYYDKDNLSFIAIREEWLWDYGDYINIQCDEEFDKTVKEELHGWAADLVRDMREALALPDQIQAPSSREQFVWMEDFMDSCVSNKQFCNEAVRALRMSHPFRRFKDVILRYGKEQAWSAYRDKSMERYVAEEIRFE